MSDKAFIMCKAVKDGEQGDTLGIQAYCKKCNTPVWLSDSSVASVKANHPDINIEEVALMCHNCGKENYKNFSQTQHAVMSDLQIKEFVDHVRKDMAAPDLTPADRMTKRVMFNAVMNLQNLALQDALEYDGKRYNGNQVLTDLIFGGPMGLEYLKEVAMDTIKRDIIRTFGRDPGTSK